MFSIYEETAFINVVDVVVGSLLEFVLTKMLKMSHCVHSLLSP